RERRVRGAGPRAHAHGLSCRPPPLRADAVRRTHHRAWPRRRRDAVHAARDVLPAGAGGAARRPPRRRHRQRAAAPAAPRARARDRGRPLARRPSALAGPRRLGRGRSAAAHRGRGRARRQETRRARGRRRARRRARHDPVRGARRRASEAARQGAAAGRRRARRRLPRGPRRGPTLTRSDTQPMLRAMLLVIDVGNTNTKIGVCDDTRLLVSWSLTTRREQTADEYGLFVETLLRTRGVEPRDVTGIAISNVVPQTQRALDEMAEKYFGASP